MQENKQRITITLERYNDLIIAEHSLSLIKGYFKKKLGKTSSIYYSDLLDIYGMFFDEPYELKGEEKEAPKDDEAPEWDWKEHLEGVKKTIYPLTADCPDIIPTETVKTIEEMEGGAE